MTKTKTETWYRAFLGDINTVQVERHTEASVWINGRRNKRHAPDYQAFFPTWAEAKLHLIEVSENDVEIALMHLKRYQDKLSRIRNLTQ